MLIRRGSEDVEGPEPLRPLLDGRVTWDYRYPVTGETRTMPRGQLTRAVIFGIVAGALATASASAQQNPDRWEKDIAAFEAADRVSPPRPGGIVFVGSSSIRRWDTSGSFPDLQVINRGFGGAELADAVRYADRIVIPYQPRLVVVYAGDNDIGNGKLSEAVVVEAERLVSRVRARLPDTRFVFIGLKPSILRWTQVDRMRATNSTRVAPAMGRVSMVRPSRITVTVSQISNNSSSRWLM